MLEKIKNQVIISVQAAYGEPLYDEAAMNAMIKTVVQLGGARVLRLAGARDIKNAKTMFPDVPVIGITKPQKLPSNCHEIVYITPNLGDCAAVADSGAEIVAFDATMRKRENSISEMVDFIHSKGKLAMADIATFEDAKNAQECGADLVSTTLSGYTDESESTGDKPDFDLLKKLVQTTNKPIILDGRIWEPDDVKRAFALGAYAVVIGSAITRPQLIVKRFIDSAK